MKNMLKIKNTLTSAALSLLLTTCAGSTLSAESLHSTTLPDTIKVEGIALNPEGIEYDKRDHTFLLSSLNAMPIIKVRTDGSFTPFTSGEKFPLSTAGLQIDYPRNRLLVAGFNGTELMDNDPKTKGAAFLRIYDLKTGVMRQEINLAPLLPNATAYFANDIAVDNAGNVYISDWYAGAIYKVALDGTPTLFWKNDSGVKGGPNGLDFHKDGYLLVSLINVNNKGIYVDDGLVKIPVTDPASATDVTISDAAFSGFDGMVITAKGTVVGVTNNGTSPGGNMLIELSSKDGWRSAKVVHAKKITPSTTVAITPEHQQYVINQDFSDNLAKSWTIEKIEF